MSSVTFDTDCEEKALMSDWKEFCTASMSYRIITARLKRKMKREERIRMKDVRKNER